jgi:hypothetical protein
MPTTRTLIDGYAVELNTNEDEGAAACAVTFGRFFGSLELLDDAGVLVDMRDAEHKVPADTIECIVRWAQARGW